MKRARQTLLRFPTDARKAQAGRRQLKDAKIGYSNGIDCAGSDCNCGPLTRLLHHESGPKLGGNFEGSVATSEKWGGCRPHYLPECHEKIWTEVLAIEV